VEVWLLANVTSAVDGGERLNSRSFQFINAGIKLAANRLKNPCQTGDLGIGQQLLNSDPN